jgi:type I restriction enzyme S subunit
MKTVALGKVAKIDRTVANDDECLSLPYVGLEHVEKERGHFADGFVPTPLNMLAANFRFTPKHVLYGKLRPYLNKVVLPSFDGVCTTEILPILPNEEKLDRTFLWAILLSPTFVNWATSQISGANLPRLDPKLLAEYEIPLPPLTEQKRIASLMARVESLRGRMGAPQSTRQVEELFESLLAEGFS